MEQEIGPVVALISGLVGFLTTNQERHGSFRRSTKRSGCYLFYGVCWSAGGEVEATFPEFLSSGRIYKSAASNPLKRWCDICVAPGSVFIAAAVRGIEFLYVPLRQRRGGKTGRSSPVTREDRDRTAKQIEGQSATSRSWTEKHPHMIAVKTTICAALFGTRNCLKMVKVNKTISP